MAFDMRELLNEVTEETVIEIMKEHGTDVYRTTRDNRTGQKCLWFKTICHGGESHKLCYFTGSKDFFCYTSCGRMTFFNFIKEIRGATKESFYKDVVLYVAKKLKKDMNKRRVGLGPRVSSQAIKDMREIEDTIMINERKFDNVVEIDKFYDTTILNYFDGETFHKSWIDDGISIESMRKYEIKWHEFRNYIIIPHYNVDNKLVGIRRRSFREDDADSRKYMPLYIDGTLYDHPLALNLYGLNHNIDAIRKSKKVIFVEGEKSVLLSDTFYGDNSIALATCGFNISEWQIQTVINLGVETVYIGFDKDFDLRLKWQYKEGSPEKYKEFLRFESRLNSLAKKFAGRAKVYLIRDKRGLLKKKDAPFDRGKDTFEKLMKDVKLLKST